MYHPGETVLLEYQGWLKAFRVVRAYGVGDGSVEYVLTMCERGDGPEWIRPG
jgi:hypothetical protein